MRRARGRVGRHEPAAASAPAAMGGGCPGARGPLPRLAQPRREPAPVVVRPRSPSGDRRWSARWCATSRAWRGGPRPLASSPPSPWATWERGRGCGWPSAPRCANIPGWTWTTCAPWWSTPGAPPRCAAPCATCPTPAPPHLPPSCATWRRACSGASAPTTWWPPRRRPTSSAPWSGPEGARALAFLAQALVDEDVGIALPDALAYVEQLVESQLLVPTWAPAVTGLEPVAHLLAASQAIPALAPVRERLIEVQTRLAALTATPGAAPEAYRQLAQHLESLPVPVALPRLFQVDASRPDSGLMLSRRVTDTVLEGVEVLRRLSARVDAAVRSCASASASPRATRTGPFRCWRHSTRSGAWACGPRGLAGRLHESAVQRPAPRATPGPRAPTPGSPLGGLAAPGGGGLARGRPGARPLARGPRRPGGRGQRRLPDAFGVMGTLVARSAEAVDAGDFRFVLEHVHGPSGAKLLGRFCHGEPELEARVREHLRAEEALRPEALFAEMVHLPQERMGNVICRPMLRRHELIFLGQSGASAEQQIGVEDLWLSLEGGRLVLRSRRLGREVIPRLSNAHAFRQLGLGVYRLPRPVAEPGAAGPEFPLGPARLGELPAPRARVDARCCRWRLDIEARAAARRGASPGGSERSSPSSATAHEARLPRWVCCATGTTCCPWTWTTRVSGHAPARAQGQAVAFLQELYPGPGELCVESGEGTTCTSWCCPSCAPARAGPAAAPAAPPARAPGPRRFPPGSEWLYLKLYTGLATADRLLRDVPCPTPCGGSPRRGPWTAGSSCATATPSTTCGCASTGSRPGWRRKHGPRCGTPSRALLADGSVWRLQLDTYEPEVERYGGPLGVELRRGAVLRRQRRGARAAAGLPGRREAPTRWRMTLKGMDLLLEDLGLIPEEKRAAALALREAFGREFAMDASFESSWERASAPSGTGLEALLAARKRRVRYPARGPGAARRARAGRGRAAATGEGGGGSTVPPRAWPTACAHARQPDAGERAAGPGTHSL